MKKWLFVLAAVVFAAVAMAPVDVLAGNAVNFVGDKVEYTIEIAFISNTPGKRLQDFSSIQGATVKAYSASFDDPVATGKVAGNKVSFSESKSNDRERRFFRIVGVSGFEWVIPVDDQWLVARQSGGKIDRSAPINWRKIGLEWMPTGQPVPDGAEWNPWDGGATK